MTKIQTILSLFLFLVIVFSMNMIFGNPIRETFRGGGGGGLGRGLGGGLGGGLGEGLGRGLGRGLGGGLGGGLGIGLGNRLALNNKSIITNDIPSYYYEQSDYEPLFFNLFKRF